MQRAACKMLSATGVVKACLLLPSESSCFLLVSVPLHHNPSRTCKGHSRSRHSLGITTHHATASLMTRRHLRLHGLQPVHGLSLV